MIAQLRRKFVILTVSICIFALLIITLSINILSYRSIIESADATLLLVTQSNLNLSPEIAPPRTMLPREAAFTARFFVVQTNSDDHSQMIDTKNIDSINPDQAEVYVALAQQEGRSSGTIDDFRYMVIPLSVGNTYIFLDIEGDLMTFYSFALGSACVLVGAIILIFIAACVLSKYAIAPIARSYEKQKQFITDVSHEFKTPLAIIQADNEVMVLDHGENEWSDSICTQIFRLNTLVENLTSLAQMDETKNALIKIDFSLSDATEETVREFSAVAQSRELGLVSQICDTVTYSGDETAIRKLVAILVENSMKYALPQSDITVALKRKGNRPVLTIENKCPQMKAGKYNQWFERFYREDQSRNSESRGFGIGLSIAKSICEQHGAKISAVSPTGTEVKISVVF